MPRQTWSADNDVQVRRYLTPKHVLSITLGLLPREIALFAALLHMLSGSSIDYDKLAELHGQGLSAKAINHRLRRIKSKFKSSGEDADDSPDEARMTPTTSTPKKRKLASNSSKAPATPKEKSTGK